MAIAFDAKANNAGVGTTWNHTVTGANTLLIVCGITNVAGGDTVTGITYNGVAMTRADAASFHFSTGVWGYIYVLAGAATGTHQVAVTLSSGTNFEGGSLSYTGCKQSSQPDAHGADGGTGASRTSSTVNLTTTADQCWLVSYVRSSSDGGGVAGTNVNALRDGTSDGDSNGGITPAGSTSIGWTNTSQIFGSVAVAIAPTPPVAPLTFDLESTLIQGVRIIGP